MTMDENVAKAVAAADEAAAQAPSDSIGVAQWQTIRARLVELEAENERLRGAIAQHRDQFPDEALDGDIALWSVLDAHLSENGHEHS